MVLNQYFLGLFLVILLNLNLMGLSQFHSHDSTEMFCQPNRFYDSKLGRFINPDTLVPDPTLAQAFNRYAYVYNNPLRYNDPSGHVPHDVLDDFVQSTKNFLLELDQAAFYTTNIAVNIFFPSDLKKDPLGFIFLVGATASSTKATGVVDDAAVLTARRLRGVKGVSGRIENQTLTDSQSLHLDRAWRQYARMNRGTIPNDDDRLDELIQETFTIVLTDLRSGKLRLDEAEKPLNLVLAYGARTLETRALYWYQRRASRASMIPVSQYNSSNLDYLAGGRSIDEFFAVVEAEARIDLIDIAWAAYSDRLREFAALNEPLGQVAQLYLIDGLERPQVAAQLGIQPDTVTQLAKQVKTGLREAVRDSMIEHFGNNWELNYSNYQGAPKRPPAGD